MALRDGRVRLDRYLLLDQLLLDLALGLLAGTALLGLWALGLRFLRRARELESNLMSILSDLRPGDALALAIISGFAEETFFRGGLQSSFRDPATGLVVAALLFAALHTGPGPAFRLWTAYALAAGALCGLLLLWRGALLAPIVAHVLVNAVNLQRLVRRRPIDPPSRRYNPPDGLVQRVVRRGVPRALRPS
jgi:membrane protease YdiL (CAAX protease family)